MPRPIRIVCLSDTHSAHDRLRVPDGDLLLHAGDFTKRGKPAEVERFGAWLAELPHAAKVVVPGNHDFLCEREPERARELLGDVTLLEGSGPPVERCGLRIWGSPHQPWFHDWAFNRERGAELAAHWASAPAGLDVLVTHTPPRGRLDRTLRGEAVGCDDLLAELPRIAPRLHVFGHIHEDRGVLHPADGPLTVNACICDLSYRPTQAPVVVEWTDAGPTVLAESTTPPARGV